ncbi:MAG: hypothetical protein HZC24_07500 [Rhodocyclales bacterium]|nr:hypothetical protein [Rhodocyclales bacterium]
MTTDVISMSNTGLLGPTPPLAAAGETAPAAAVGRGARRFFIGLVVAALIALGAWVAVAAPYTPGSELGYNLGLAGGLLMLALLLYPVRKRVRAFERLGKMADWFKFHMVAGIGGPLLVLFHSTFKLNSLNGSVAFYAMLLVAGSGVVGRFIYRHVHRGLYGRRLTLDGAQADLLTSRENVNSVFALRPDVEARLLAFHDYAFAPLVGTAPRVWRFVTLRWRGRRLSRAVRRDVKFALTRLQRDGRLSRQEVAVNYRLAREQILGYLDGVVRTSQLSVWEKLFSLWHVIHIPFLYLLLFAGIVHVLAVHMY